VHVRWWRRISDGRHDDLLGRRLLFEVELNVRPLELVDTAGEHD
jgi:hypothetical protein